jgi:hypothetical protein
LNKKHFIPLQKHLVTHLIIKLERIRLYYTEIQATLCQVSTHYCPINSKMTTRRIIDSIEQKQKCFQFTNTEQNHVIGELPKDKINPSRNLTNIEIDYYGPFYIKEKKHFSKLKIFKKFKICCNFYIFYYKGSSFRSL